MIDVRSTSHTVAITLAGDFDLTTTAALARILDLVVAESWRVVVVECAEVTFIDLVGAGPLADAAATAAACGVEFVLLHPKPHVARVFDFLGLTDRVVATEQPPYLNGYFSQGVGSAIPAST
jgi:anti-anti-sigma factor